MKLILIFLTVIVGVFAEEFLEPGELNVDTYFTTNDRIAAGIKTKKGENLDFCYLNVRFIQKSQVCGCAVVHKEWVLTSGRCLADPQEGKATNVTVTIFGLPGKAGVRLSSMFLIPDGVNGADEAMEATLELYDFATDIPFKAIGPNNVGMVKLAKPLDEVKELNGKKVKKAELVMAADLAAFEANFLPKFKFRVCGIGAIDNKGTKSKGLLCGDMDVKKADVCAEALAAEEPVLPEDETAVCLVSSSENNVCSGDYGGPVWAYMYDGTGKVITQFLLGVTVGSLNIRNNSPCLGGQTIVAMITPGKVEKWVKGVIDGRSVP
jgi:hypothetical protein